MDQKVIKEVAEILINSISTIKQSEVTVSFSGGIDSSFLAFLIKKYNPNVKNIELVYAGLKDTADYKFSLKASKLIDLPLVQYILDEKLVVQYSQELRKLINTEDIIEVSYLFPFFAVCKRAKYKTVVIGQGADELFLGYHKFKKNLENANELSKKMYQDLKDIVDQREHKIASNFNKLLLMPYLYYNLGEYVMSLDSRYKNDGKEVKIILREVAKYLGLPDEIANRPKKAAQYGSGVWKIIKNTTIQ